MQRRLSWRSDPYVTVPDFRYLQALVGIGRSWINIGQSHLNVIFFKIFGVKLTLRNISLNL
jgi:hypothetical protein